MKLRDYTYQSGHCVTHDTDVAILSSNIYVQIRGMIQAGSGRLGPVAGISYRFTDAEEFACLSVEGTNGPIWIALIVPYKSVLAQALCELDGIAESLTLHGWPVSSALPDAVVTPCVITLLLPGIMGLDRARIELLGGVPRDFACVWLSEKFGM